MHYYAALATALLLGYAVWGLLSDKGTMSHRQVDQIDGEASAANLGSGDHVYSVILALFAVVNWYVLYQANRDMTGLSSIATLVGSFMSLIVLILALVQFWNKEIRPPSQAHPENGAALIRRPADLLGVRKKIEGHRRSGASGRIISCLVRRSQKS